MASPLAERAARTLLPLGLLGALVALALAAAGRSRLPPADFTFNNAAEVTTLDPATISGVPEGRIARHLFEGLVVLHPRTLEPLPGMAERWEVSDDGLVYTFHLRRGALWSNGDEVTAHDFVYSWRRLLDPRTGAEYAYQLWPVRGARAFTSDVDADGSPRHPPETVGVRARDDHTLEVELEAPTPYFVSLTGFYSLFPVNPRNLEEARARHPDRWQLEWVQPDTIVTNGPWRVAERRVNDRIRLVKNPRYWDAESVAFETIDALAIDHLTTGLNLYLTGGCDWIDRVPVTVIPRLWGREDFQPAPYLGVYFFRVNVTRPPLDDPRVRRALSLAIDRGAITSKITKAGELPTFGYVPRGLAGYPRVELRHADRGDGSPAAQAAALAADLAQARALLAEAGYGPDGRPFPTLELHYNTDETHEDIAEVVADGWRRHLGIEAKLLNQEWKVYLDTQQNVDYDVSRSAWIGDYADPNTFLDMFLADSANNRTGWSSARFDALVREAGASRGEERLRLLAAAEAILLEELPILPVYEYVTRNLVDPRLGGFHPNVQDVHQPKFLYWKSDAELAADRAELPPGTRLVPAPGPAEGLYPPARRAGGPGR